MTDLKPWGCASNHCEIALYDMLRLTHSDVRNNEIEFNMSNIHSENNSLIDIAYL